MSTRKSYTAIKKLSEIKSWDDFFSYAKSLSEKEKGDIFETLTKLILTTKPEYSSILKNVWIHSDGIPIEIRERLNLPNTDEGIDLIAETFSGEFWAIQCKFKGKNEAPTYTEISTFTYLANTHCKNISLVLLVHTGEKGVRKRKLLGEHYSEIGLEFWLGLTDEDWLLIHKNLKGQSIRPNPKKPRPHQQQAINRATKHFVANSSTRGRLVMPCGTGKSLTAFWIANAVKAKSIIVVVPSLALIKQSLEDWTREFLANNEEPRPDWLVICSDESTSNLDQDDFVSDAYSLGIPTTTKVDEINSFLSKDHKGRVVVFTTYQSSDRLAQAAKQCNYCFDFAVLDEAHKTVGVRSKSFSTLLQDENISINKRMFMTATERVVRGNTDEVSSMDDPEIYGNLFYRLSFKDAIHADPPIISDYKILTIAVTHEEISQLIAKNKLITDKAENIEEEQAQSLAAAITLRKATQTYGINHAISFHRSIRSADNFSKLNRRLNDNQFDDIQLKSNHISSKKSAGERARLLTDFSNDPLALMTNARCLTEGVDVPAIDCVLFADPKQSTIDIVQAAGRALRPYAGKQCGYIMIPLIVPDDVSFDEFAETTPFKVVARIIAALSTQDEGIAEEFRITSAGKQTSGVKIVFTGSIPVGLKLDLSDFAEKINARIWERVGKANWLPFDEARAFIMQLKIKNRSEYGLYCLTGEKPANIPSNPDKTYPKADWRGWGYWLGNGNISVQLREYRSFEEAREFVQHLNIKGENYWREYCKSGRKPNDIPAHPDRTYLENGWISWGNWLGNDSIAPWKKEYRSFEDAKTFVRNLGLKSNKQWNEYSRSEKRPRDIPTNPNKTYKNAGWISAGDWLGTGNIAPQNRKYRTFKEAKEYIHALRLKSESDWKDFSSLGKPEDIPAAPHIVYRDKGWAGMADWLGGSAIAKRNKDYRSFEAARGFVHQLNLLKSADWREYCSSGNKPDDIPAYPNRVYLGKGWAGMADWLGGSAIAKRNKDYRSFEAARGFVHQLNLLKSADWREYCSSGNKPDDIPATPAKVYHEKGWLGWGDWFGTGAISNRYKKYRVFAEARSYVHGLKIKSRSDWDVYCKSGKKPDDIPNSPALSYKRKGWISMNDWLGKESFPDRYKIHRSFQEARSFIRQLNLNSFTEWRGYCKSGEKPENIPSNPNKIYKADGWISWGDWLGTFTIATNLKKYRSFVEARAFARNLSLKTQHDWNIYSKSKEMPLDIPKFPNETYAGKGWVGMGDWLGNGKNSPLLRYYRPFEEARVFVHQLQLKSGHDWRKYTKSGEKPDDIPANPEKVYSKTGWTSWGDWLGTGTIAPSLREYRPFEQARTFIHHLNLLNVNDWYLYCKTGNKPKDIPSNPDKTYKGKGWVGMGDWLGKDK